MSTDDMLPKEWLPSKGRTGREVEAWEWDLRGAEVLSPPLLLLPVSLSELPPTEMPSIRSVPLGP